MLLLDDSAIVVLSIYPKELKIYVHTKTCTQIFIVALFIIAKTWKQLRCPFLTKSKSVFSTSCDYSAPVSEETNWAAEQYILNVGEWEWYFFNFFIFLDFHISTTSTFRVH